MLGKEVSSMDNEKTQQEQPHQQRLKGIEARLTVLEEQVEKCDRLSAPWI